MTRKVSSGVVVPSAAAAASALLICFVVWPATARFLAQAQSTGTSRQGDSATDRNLVVVGNDVREKTIRFGGELVVLVILKNQGTTPIRIPPSALLLNNERWIQGGGEGSGVGESQLVPTGVNGKEDVTLQPGESLTFSATSVDLAAHSTGSMKAEFVVQTEDQDVRRELGKQELFTVSYYVAPSALMTAAWAAKTAEDLKRLQPQIRDLLLLASRPDDSPAFYVPTTLDHLGCRTVELLESALRDSDPVVREQAVHALHRAQLAANNLKNYLDQLSKEEEGRTFAASVERCGEQQDQDMRKAMKLAITSLADPAARVRSAAIAVLTMRASSESYDRRWMTTNPRPREKMDEREKQMYDSIGVVDPALPLIKKLASDSDAGVRAEAQKFLTNFASQPGVAGDVVAALGDADAGVRNQALQALRTSHEPPTIATIEKAFASTKGDVALGLIELMFEREDVDLALRLTPGFKDRSAAERLMILTAIAGHTDDAALNLVISGLKDSDNVVRRTALARLLGFPSERAISVIKDSAIAAGDTRVAVQKELGSRALFPFLARRGGSAAESVFPSVQGTGPVVSPDGKWVAYVETGWGRPGGTGGTGRSNLLSITHVALRDGSLDRVVSDMFLVGWMPDSRRLACARDGFATIVNLNGKTVTEFGELLDKPYTGKGFFGGFGGAWPTGEIRGQGGVTMPHSKMFQWGPDPKAMFDFDSGEDAGFSPDGRWFGPRKVNGAWQFVDSEGNKIELKTPRESMFGGERCIWSPDGNNLVVIPVHSGGNVGTAIESREAFVIDFSGRALRGVFAADQVPIVGGWDYRQGRWNPWSRDGKRLAFIRQGQVWTSDLDGNATQLTFDVWNKVFPTFSPDGTKIAYVTWQFDNREHYSRLGPTDIWVVDLKTGLAARVTRADPGHIEDLDWLDNETLIFDRLAPDDLHSTLRTVSLVEKR